MPITKEKKREIIENLKNILKDSKSIVFVNFHGLPVSNETEVRTKLYIDNIGYLVAKKTLVKRALIDQKISGETPELNGELALVYGGEDITAPARGIHEFIKKNKDNISILGGIFEGKFMNKEEMTEIAAIPRIEVLYGQIVNLINSPIQGFVMALSQITEKKEA